MMQIKKLRQLSQALQTRRTEVQLGQQYVVTAKCKGQQLVVRPGVQKKVGERPAGSCAQAMGGLCSLRASHPQTRL